MTRLREVRVGIQPLERFREVLGEEEIRDALRIANRLRHRLAKRVVWNVNSTPVGGGVAEMLPSLLSYARAVGIDTRWMVIGAPPEFFRVTKRLHHALHGSPGDGQPLDARARAIYESALEDNALELATLVRPGDFAVLHDPQTAGLAPALRRCGVRVIWRCHIGHDAWTPEVERGWRFLAPYLRAAQRYVFSRKAYVPEICDHGRSRIIPPSIDAFSPKNQELRPEAVRGILVHVGLLEGPPPPGADTAFLREDGSPGRVERRADILRLGRAPSPDAPLVVQVSRWDPLKDMGGVMEGYARMVDGRLDDPSQLVLAGPNVTAVADDPEAARVFDEVAAAWRELPHSLRDRVHLACLPTADIQENAAIVNALQRHASVVVQKSLHEGFGLTVTEAMWKGRAVLASAVGGIQDQIEDGISGRLLRDPRDLDRFAELLGELLGDPALQARLGEAARERVRRHFLGLGHLLRYAELLEELDEEAGPPRACSA